MTETQRLSCLIQALHDAWAQHKGNAHEDGCGWCIFETALHERMMATEAAASVLAPKEPPKGWLDGPGMTCRCGEYIAGPIAMTRHHCATATTPPRGENPAAFFDPCREFPRVDCVMTKGHEGRCIPRKEQA